jgi:hypothetical protein
MWSSDLRISGIDPVHASNLWSLLTLQGSRARQIPMAFALLDRGRPTFLVVGRRHAPVPAGFDRISPENAGPLAAALGVRLLVAAEEEAARDIVEDVQTRWRHGDDHLVQAGIVLQQIRVALDEGSVIVWPDFFTVLARLEADTMQRTFDAVFPPESAAILYVFRKQAIHSALITVRGPERIEAVSGHWSVREQVGTFHPWQDGYPRILKAVEAVHRPPSLGFFAEFETVREMLEDPRPGQLSRAIMDRRVIVDPMPAWMAAALGLDALTRAARLSMDLLEKADRLGIGRRFDLAGVRKEVKSHIDRQVDLEALLGFDPFDYISRFVTWWSGRT